MIALHDSMSQKFASSDIPEADEAIARAKPVEFPGRWVGGAVGAVASVLVGTALSIVPRVVGRPERWADDNLLASAATVAFLGIPIAFVLGRHLAPIASGDGWRSAAAAAATFALLAPPLGDIEIIGGLGMAPWSTGASAGPLEALAGGMLIGGVGLVVSYVALPVTAAVAVVWIALMRLVPADRAAGLRMPATVARFGVRHVVFLALLWIVVGWTIWTIVRPPHPFA